MVKFVTSGDKCTLNAPRAWAYIKLYKNDRPSVDELRLWLRRSGTAPLHITVFDDFTFDNHINMMTLYELLCEYRARIASLRMRVGKLAFFEGNDFPCMQHLAIQRWSHALSTSARWGRMPQRRSLRLGRTTWP